MYKYQLHCSKNYSCLSLTQNKVFIVVHVTLAVALTDSVNVAVYIGSSVQYVQPTTINGKVLGHLQTTRSHLKMIMLLFCITQEAQQCIGFRRKLNLIFARPKAHGVKLQW